MLNIFRSRRSDASAAPNARLDAGKRVYAVGDVHGSLRLLQDLLEQCRADALDAPEDESWLVFLGDYVDRGPHSREVIDLLARDAIGWARTVFLMGNHEEAFLGALDGDIDMLRRWVGFGGMETCESYGLSQAAWAEGSPERFLDRLRRLVPPAHVAFLRNLYDSFSLGEYLFVHAGVRPGVALDEQDPTDMRWIREDFLNATGDHGQVVVHGHTISEAPEMRRNRIGIDTGAYRTGRLTAVALDGGRQRFLVACQSALADLPGEG